MRATGRLGVYLLVLLGLFGCTRAWGQTNGEIRGTVNDPSGAIVPGATITATLNGTDTTRTVTSDKDGAFDHSRTGRRAATTSPPKLKVSRSSSPRRWSVTIGHVNFITVTLQIGGTATIR